MNHRLTKGYDVVIISNMKATQLIRTRIPYSTNAFAELILWQLVKPALGFTHHYKYRLAYVADGICVVRYGNESGKGDHRHFDDKERAYQFSTVDKLIADFQRDIIRWNNENNHA
jgi:hypothetical protein